jgi:hypothetical protein
MKRVILLLVLAMSITAASAQTNKYNFKPYAGAGASVSSGEISYGAELGIYNDNTWLALGASVFQDPAYINHWTTSFKYYRKVLESGIVSTYGYGAVNLSIDKTRTLSFEPGAAVVIDFGKIAPQFSFGLPITENTSFKVNSFTFGVGINYWIK